MGGGPSRRSDGVTRWQTGGMPLGSEESRFMSLADVAEVLSISATQAYALVRREELDAIRIGGRGQWRVERVALEKYIQQQYSSTREYLTTHPFREAAAEDEDDARLD